MATQLHRLALAALPIRRIITACGHRVLWDDSGTPDPPPAAGKQDCGGDHKAPAPASRSSLSQQGPLYWSTYTRP